MGFADHFAPAPSIRPMFNVGGLFDIATGTYYTGEHGESILNGGVPHITGVGGRGNTGKSLISDYFFLAILDRYPCAEGNAHDTEMSKTYARMMTIAQKFDHLKDVDLQGSGRLFLSDAATTPGEVWFQGIKAHLAERRKNASKLMKTTPFVFNGERFKMISPSLVMLDSFSQWIPTTVVTMHDKNTVGSSDLNTEAMKAGSARSQLMAQLPMLMGSSGGYIFLTAHIGDEIVMDTHAPSKKKLETLSGDTKYKRTPENFTFLTNNLWRCRKAAVLKQSGTKELAYPIGKAGDSEGDTDLKIIDLQIDRGKGGGTGRIFEIIFSQVEGVLPHLSQFHHIKEGDRWGLGGNNINYFLDLAPDIALSRTVMRAKIAAHANLRRALEISSEMLQIKELWITEPGLMCTPKELYDDLKAKGYDWDVLLNTRGYWMFEEDITPETKPFLSTMDLLKMRRGEYHPYWMSKLK